MNPFQNENLENFMITLDTTVNQGLSRRTEINLQIYIMEVTTKHLFLPSAVHHPAACTERVARTAQT